jgi:hypothetical protein
MAIKAIFTSKINRISGSIGVPVSATFSTALFICSWV